MPKRRWWMRCVNCDGIQTHGVRALCVFSFLGKYSQIKKIKRKKELGRERKNILRMS